MHYASSFKLQTSCLQKQQMNGFHNICDAVGVDGVVNEFTVPLGFDDAGPAQDGQVLGSYRLLEAQLYIEFCDCQLFMLVQDAHDLLPEFVIEGPQDHRGLL